MLRRCPVAVVPRLRSLGVLRHAATRRMSAQAKDAAENDAAPEYISGVESKPPTRDSIIVSGIQPTGVPTLGNYLGAMRNWARQQSMADRVLFFVVDQHSITVPQNPTALRENAFEMAVALLAVGIDPARSLIFMQSQVPHHTELMWILACNAPTGWLSRMTQWKAKLDLLKPQTQGNLMLGLYAYPVLMAADILVYRATHVPVGDDQTQHLELARNLVGAFNSSYKTSFFPAPNAIYGEVPRVMSLRAPTMKMSKSDPSDASRINLTDDDDLIRKKIRRAVTDSVPQIAYDPETRPGVANLLRISAAIQSRGGTVVTPEALASEFAARNASLSDLKDAVADIVVAEIAPVRKEMARLRGDKAYVQSVVQEGGRKAREMAEETMTKVRRIVGFR